MSDSGHGEFVSPEAKGIAADQPGLPALQAGGRIGSSPTFCRLGGLAVRLVSLAFAVVWSAIALLGFLHWQASTKDAIQKGVAPPLLDVFAMVLIPGILAAFSLARIGRRERKQENGDPPQG